MQSRTALPHAVLLVFLLPLVASQNVVKLSSFGVTPNTGIDQTNAMISAFQSIWSTPNSILLFDQPGTFHIKGLGKQNFYSTSNITIDGQNSTVVITVWTGFVAMNGGVNVRFQNLIIDYDPLPNVGGLILGSNQAGQWIDLAVDPVYKVSDVLNQTIVAYSYYVPNEYGGSFDGACDVTGFSETATITTSPVDYAENTTWAVVRIPIVGHVHCFPREGRFLWVRFVATGSAFGWYATLSPASENVVFENVTIHSSPGFGIFPGFTNNFTMINVNVVKYPGRYATTNLDIVHMHELRGHVEVRDTLLEGSGDDGLAISNTVTYVNAVSASTVTLPPGTSAWIVGDTIAFSHNTSIFQNFASALIQSAFLNTTTTILTLQGGVPEGVRVGDYVAHMTVVSSSYTRVTVRNNRARALLLKNHNAIVDNCTFINQTGPAIQLAADAGTWWEGAPPRDIVIQNSKIIGSMASSSPYVNELSSTAGAIQISLWSPLGEALPGGAQRIAIEGNTFANIQAPAFWVGSVINITITDNTLDNISGWPLMVCNTQNLYAFNNLLQSSPYNNTVVYSTAGGCNNTLSTNVNTTNAWDGLPDQITTSSIASAGVRLTPFICLYGHH